MAYVKEPPKDLWIDRIFLGFIYVLMAAGSVTLWALTPASPVGVVPALALDIAGIIGAVGCLVALVAVFKFWLLVEMTAIWVSVLGIVAYAFGSWLLVPETPTRASFAIFLTIPIAFVNWRSWRLRREAHREGGKDNGRDA